MKSHRYIVRGKKIVTVSPLGTIDNGALAVEDGKILAVGRWKELQKHYPSLPVIDYSNYVITPSLVDCHTHLLEFAPSSLYATSPENHFAVGKALLLSALSSGITALGEQICGHPFCDFSVCDYRSAVLDMPLDVSFATTSISIGFEKLAHYTAVTQSQAVEKKELINPDVVKLIAQASDYPGENIFINATPANFTADEVPRAGEIIYTLAELKKIVEIYHQSGKKIGTHVAGEVALRMALEAGVDVLHHAHGITDQLIKKVAEQQVRIVATPMGGTHLLPNSPEEILTLVNSNIAVSISTDAYLPPYQGTSWLPFQDQTLKGPDVLMLIANPAMQLLKQYGYDENEILAMLTAHPAEILGKEDYFGRLEQGLDANFLVAEGIPGLDIIEIEKIRNVFFRGEKVIDRIK
ncbi:amidohydrolase family protein [Sporosarcina sp. YIM B06819]|uniref:amidohydrolase family protein n=1 Tax=Sporosarcina sp. YIM B06819 TaxID=3081769 RepID=UPI00298CAF7D|nr:amidohydrolase family protein [Sporosarcina sp. YIM B06819]